MQLYTGLSRQFLQDTRMNQIAGKLRESFFRHFGYYPSDGEVRSWHNSLRAMALALEGADLFDHGIVLEYQLPLTSKRLDCMVCGKDFQGRDNAIIVELKQWEWCEESSGEDLVVTWVGNHRRDTLHPSAQVRQYHLYLKDSHTAFYEEPDPITLHSCAYLHNYYPKHSDPLFGPKFERLLAEYPTFTADDAPRLESFLAEHLEGGKGDQVLEKVLQSKYRPSKKLLDHVAKVIQEETPQFVLLDEQLVVFEKVMALARQGFHDRRKHVLLVRGGPGTGKSVIALNLMAQLSREGYNVHYATGSRAFTQTLRKIVGTRGSAQFKYFMSYYRAHPNEIDVLVCDEAHRLRSETKGRHIPKALRTGKPQIRELIDAAQLCVFLIDDKQVVRPGEIGSSHYIREQAKQAGCEVLEYELEVQFRCAGSEAFVNWVNNTLDIEKTANEIWQGDERFDFQILDSPQALEEAIRKRVREGFSARIVAGFCWPWSPPQPDGTLVDDIVIGEFRKPWNAKSDSGRLAKGIPKESLWAHDPNGINQIGCVYTAQGFEFDYVGVIFGPDLRYNFDTGQWDGHPEASYDPELKRAGERFTELVKNTYRVLLSRGLKGCYVYFVDKDTERFVRSRIEPGAISHS